MKTLTLLRHAKSGWDDPVSRDFDRPLNPRGRRAARAVALEMKAQGLTFDRVLASPARRVIETLEEVEAAYGPLRPDYDQRLYLASTATLLEIVRGASADVGRLLLVGHNPGLEELALALSRRDEWGLRREVELKYPTGTVAELALPVERWSEVGEASGRIERFIRPRDLDPGLGPDSE
ncbi:MAG TPA: histidine phosphatase family protein [Allosphingosinicella sp.]|jgi:phosphohistidine phosphatase|nr:histidine phosphatase family protein [Allosphingosinicella sp.]